MIKKAISLLLAAVFAASALASCAGAPGAAKNANIRVTSSDGESAAAWLDARLGDLLTDRVVLGTDADRYGVSLDALEDDGYVIRDFGGEVALFARTTDGLDRAVRRYAKAVERGEPIADATYHEGYRIEELRFAGVPVGEFAIAVEGGNDYIRGWVTKNAAAPFAELLKIACGADVAVGGDAEHKIIFRQIDAEGWKESSYHYFFDGADLIFEYVDLAGARNGMVKFLEAECGWDDLYYGFDELAESELIDVSADTDVLCHPRFGGIRLTTLGSFRSNTMYRVNAETFNYKYRVESAHHHLGRTWGTMTNGTLPCLTDDGVLEDIAEQIAGHVDDRISAGEKIGDEIVSVNLGIADTHAWCACRNCLKVAKDEGATWAGPMVYFVNRIDDALDEAGYDGLKFPIFAYVGSNIPPKTAPHDDVYVTFVCDGYCTNHSLDGSQCLGKCINHVYSIYGAVSGNNRDMASWIKGWRELCDHVYVRPAPLDTPLHAITIIDQLYDEIEFLTECGVECIYNEIYANEELNTNLIATELYEAMTFDPDMTRAEYYEEVARLFEKYYGDGWQGAYDYIECLEETEIGISDCWTAWHSYAFVSDATQNDHALYRELWDRMLSSLESAERSANSAVQEQRVKRLRISALIGGCYASYYYAYEEGDDERIAMLCERWDEMIALSKQVGMYDGFDGLVKRLGLQYEEGAKLIYDSLEDTAWIGAWAIGWYHDREEMLKAAGYDAKDLRPAPERYAKD